MSDLSRFLFSGGDPVKEFITMDFANTSNTEQTIKVRISNLCEVREIETDSKMNWNCDDKCFKEKTINIKNLHNATPVDIYWEYRHPLPLNSFHSLDTINAMPLLPGSRVFVCGEEDNEINKIEITPI